MKPFELSLVFALLLAIPILLGVIRFLRRKTARGAGSLENLARRVNGTLSRKSLLQGDLMEGHHDTMPFSCHDLRGSKNRPPSLTIQVQACSPFKLALRPKSRFDRFAERIGLMATPQTRDPLFDQSYLLETEQDDVVESYLADTERRRNIERIFALGFPVKELGFDQKGLRIVLSPFRKEFYERVPLEDYLDGLVSLSRGLPSANCYYPLGPQGFSGLRRSPLSKVGLVFLFAFTALLFPVGMVSLILGLQRYQLLDHGVIVTAVVFSIPVSLTFLSFVFLWIRGRPSSHKFFLILLILAQIGFPLAAIGGAVLTNGLWDEGPTTERQVVVTERFSRQGKNGKTWHLVYPSWQHPGERERVGISYRLYQQVRRGDAVVLRTRPGYWRKEWIAGVTPVRAGTKPPEGGGIFPLRLQSIRFFESGNTFVPPKGRCFVKEFNRATARFIHAQIDMANGLWREKDRTYTFLWRYFKPDGTVLGELSLPFTIRSQWETAWVSQGWGWELAGQWPVGNYRVVVLVDGHSLGEGTFFIR